MAPDPELWPILITFVKVYKTQRQLQIKECGQVVKICRIKKVSDLTVLLWNSIYFFWNDIKVIICKALNNTFSLGKLSNF